MKQLCRAILLCGELTTGLLHGQVSIADALSSRNQAPAQAALADQALSPPANVEAALHEAFLDASIVFTGEVTAVDQDAGSVLIHWKIEQGVKGITAGSKFVQREWQGWWAADNARYVPGERALVLLRAPSVAGYTSPVRDGIIPLQGAAGNGSVDLRWIAQHVAVTDAARLAPVHALEGAHGSFTAAAALQATSAARPSQPRSFDDLRAPEPSSHWSGPIASDPNARVDGSIVFDLLHAWQRSSGAAQ